MVAEIETKLDELLLDGGPTDQDNFLVPELPRNKKEPKGKRESRGCFPFPLYSYESIRNSIHRISFQPLKKPCQCRVKIIARPTSLPPKMMKHSEEAPELPPR